MRTRMILVALVLALVPGGAAASDRILVSGKLDAANSYDFSCSVVNKSMFDITVELEIKNPDGTTYVDPVTFQPVTLTQSIDSQEAAMLTAAAGFAGVTSVYCWAEVPEIATVFGAFLVRDAQDRAAAATPLKEDTLGIARDLQEQTDQIATKIQNLPPLPGPVTGHERSETCTAGDFPPGDVVGVAIPCASDEFATGGGCRATGNGGDPALFRHFHNAPTVNPCDPLPTGWQCRWRSYSTTNENVNLCANVICVDDGGPSVLSPP